MIVNTISGPKMWNDVHHARHLSLQLRGINDELGSYIK